MVQINVGRREESIQKGALASARHGHWTALRHANSTCTRERRRGPAFGHDKVIIASSLTTDVAQWIDFDFTITRDEKLDEMSLYVLRIIGTIMRLFEGDCVLLNQLAEYPGIVRRVGNLMVENYQWHWTKEEVQHLGIPYVFDRIFGQSGIDSQ